jgi:hypothetical protein
LQELANCLLPREFTDFLFFISRKTSLLPAFDSAETRALAESLCR